MKALLVTKCGCSKMIDIANTYPEIMIPMDPTPSIVQNTLDSELLSATLLNTRRFRLREQYTTINNVVIYIYQEA